MAGCSLRYGGELPAGPNAMQQEVIDRVEGLMKVMEPTGRPPHTEAAYRELLKGRSVYEVESGNVNLAAYQEELLSVPDDVRDCPLVSDVLPAGARHYLEAYHERMLRTPEEFEEAERTGPHIQPYFDARLKYNKKAYYRFVQKLQCGFVAKIWLYNMFQLSVSCDSRNGRVNSFNVALGTRFLGS